MEAKNRKPGSVRLNEEQYTEMERLGFTNESAYVRYKMDQAQTKLEVLKTPEGDQIKMLPATKNKVSNHTPIEDQLTIQRLAMENSKLREQLDKLDEHNREALTGINHKVHTLLQEELQKRDYEELKKSYSVSELKVKQLQENLDEAQKEIEALVKKLGFVELGKALLPGAISGLAKQYPKQMQNVAGTLGKLGLSDGETNTLTENQDHLTQIVHYLQEVFTEEQFEQILQLMIQLGEQIQSDQGLIQKVAYYLNQLQRRDNAKQKKTQIESES